MISGSSSYFPDGFAKGNMGWCWLLQDGSGAEVLQQNVIHPKSKLTDSFVNLADH